MVLKVGDSLGLEGAPEQWRNIGKTLADEALALRFGVGFMPTLLPDPAWKPPERVEIYGVR
jgi:hypothetical protein